MVVGATVSEAMTFLVLLLKQASKYCGIGVKEGKTNGKLFNLLFIQSEVNLCLFAGVFFVGGWFFLTSSPESYYVFCPYKNVQPKINEIGPQQTR